MYLNGSYRGERHGWSVTVKCVDQSLTQLIINDLDYYRCVFDV